MADGPVIQRASERALRHRVGVPEVLQVVADARKETDVPIILFSYFNPLLQFGIEKLAKESKVAGVDGILVTDLIPEEASEFAATLRQHDLDLIFLVAPTSTDERLRLITERASGFVYAVSRAGVTGERTEMSAEAENWCDGSASSQTYRWRSVSASQNRNTSRTFGATLTRPWLDRQLLARLKKPDPLRKPFSTSRHSHKIC